MRKTSVHGTPEVEESGTNYLEGSKSMRKAVVYGTVVVALATVANLLHMISHIGQVVLSLEAWQWA